MNEKGQREWIVFFFGFSWFVFLVEFCVDEYDYGNYPDYQDNPGEGNAIVAIRCLCGIQMVSEENQAEISGYHGLLFLW